MINVEIILMLENAQFCRRNLKYDIAVKCCHVVSFPNVSTKGTGLSGRRS